MENVVLGFSGGVDSSVAALLLKEKGYEVHGLYFDVLKSGNQEALLRAEECAFHLGIGFSAVNLHQRFDENVIEPFCKAYCSGRTPNPCILCNPVFKFRVLKEKADELQAPWIATGHYASVVKKGRFFFAAKAKNPEKDQSYMLCRLEQDILSRVIFPLSEFTAKDEIRGLAAAAGLKTASVKDSQDICFIPEGSIKDFLAFRNCPSVSGHFISPDGKDCGPHKGQENYTIGQRKGLGIALGRPVFVRELCPDGNVLLSDEEQLFRRNVYLENLHHTGTEAVHGGRFLAKLRYTKKEAACFLEPLENGRALLLFEEGQRAPAPGQEAVLYKEGRIVCCGTISSGKDR